MLQRTLYGLGRALAKALSGNGLRLDVRWRGPFPLGPKIVAINHPTSMDPLLVMTLSPEPIHFLTNGGLFRAPLLGAYLRLAGHLPLTGGNTRAIYERALALLARGGTLGIFPEGCIHHPDSGRRRGGSGAARLALRSGAPVVPVGIYLPAEGICLREYRVGGRVMCARWYWRGPCALTIGAPLWFRRGEQVRGVTARIIEEITALAREGALRLERAGLLARGAAR